MSATELVEWQAYDRIEPIGERRADVLAALICKMIADVNTPGDKPRVRLAELIPKWDWEAPEPVTDEGMLANAEMWAVALGAGG